jgi:hypothetical protein
MRPHRLLWALALAALFCAAALPAVEDWEALSGDGGGSQLARLAPRLDRSPRRFASAVPLPSSRPTRRLLRSGAGRGSGGGSRTTVRLLIHRFNE